MATNTSRPSKAVESLFTDIHICEMARECDQQAEANALFRGSLTLVCKDCARDAVEQYDATLYNSHGSEVQLQKMAGRDVIVKAMS